MSLQSKERVYKMKLSDLKIEYQNNPVGIDVLVPRFSWIILSNENGIFQTHYKIIIEIDNEIVWDSKKIESDQSILIPYEGLKLKKQSIYNVTVEIWTNKGETAKIEGVFETGLLNYENVTAKMITSGFAEENTATPIFSKEFNPNKKIKHARIYATALGVYEIKINGSKVGNTYFAPGWTNYKKRLQYQTYNIDQMLAPVNNLIEITVGNGWYKGYFGLDVKKNNYGDKEGILAEIHLFYEDGTSEVITTDDSWSVGIGKILSSEMYMGETYDSTKEQQIISKASYLEFDKSILIAQESEPVRITKKLPALKFLTSPKGEKIIDFGQNLTGFVEIKLKEKFGHKVTIRHAETLDKDGNFYPETLRKAVSIDEFICDGTDQVFLPYFTFHGFRYIAIEGIENINVDNFTACVLQTDYKETGSIKSSHALLNQLYSNITWSQRGNFLDIPTDCPQRDERLGWTGDAQVFSKTATLNSNVALFYTKWLRDLYSEQTKENGVPHVVPNISVDRKGAAGWSDAATIMPWNVYESYGDIKVLEEQYDSMKEWVEYIVENTNENGLWQSGFQYGDWLSLDIEQGSNDFTGATDKYLVANAFFIHSTNILVKTATLLGRNEDIDKYSALVETTKQKFNAEYITSTGRVINGTQTACILALHFNIAEEKHRDRILLTLKENIKKHGHHLTTGFIGTPYLCHVLSENGLHDIAGEVFMKEKYPSWFYPVTLGATTIWERWNSIHSDGSFDESGMNSLNHYSYGSIGEWLYTKVGGINLLEPGYKKISIKPMFVKGIDTFETSIESPYGVIACSWVCKNNKITIDVEIPHNTTAILQLPDKETVTEIESGKHHFEYATDISLLKNKFSFDSTIEDLAMDEIAVQIANTYAPGMFDDPSIKSAYNFTINDAMDFLDENGKLLFTEIIKALNNHYNQIDLKK